jgi:hypothetical protein
MMNPQPESGQVPKLSGVKGETETKREEPLYLRCFAVYLSGQITKELRTVLTEMLNEVQAHCATHALVLIFEVNWRHCDLFILFFLGLLRPAIRSKIPFFPQTQTSPTFSQSSGSVLQVSKSGGLILFLFLSHISQPALSRDQTVSLKPVSHLPIVVSPLISGSNYRRTLLLF